MVLLVSLGVLPIAAAAANPITATLYGPNMTLVIRTKAELLASWKEIDTPGFIAIAEKAVPHEMFVHDGAALVDEIGYIWYGGGPRDDRRPEH